MSEGSAPEPAPVVAGRIVSDVDALLGALTEGRLSTEDLPPRLVPALLTLGIKLFAALRDAGDPPNPFLGRDVVTATEVSVAVTHALRAAEIDLFELVLWQGLA